MPQSAPQRRLRWSARAIADYLAVSGEATGPALSHVKLALQKGQDLAFDGGFTNFARIFRTPMHPAAALACRSRPLRLTAAWPRPQVRRTGLSSCTASSRISYSCILLLRERSAVFRVRDPQDRNNQLFRKTDSSSLSVSIAGTEFNPKWNKCSVAGHPLTLESAHWIWPLAYPI